MENHGNNYAGHHIKIQNNESGDLPYNWTALVKEATAKWK